MEAENASVREVPDATEAGATSGPTATVANSAQEEDAALKLLPLLLKALFAAISNFFRRIFGGAGR